jgi:hypothetical protein
VTASYEAVTGIENSNVKVKGLIGFNTEVRK